MKIGAQLYTVRDFTRDLDSFSETLKKIAAIGYRAVQVSGACAYEPEWLAGQLRANGLVCPVTHVSPDRIAEEPERVAAEHTLFGCGIAGIGCAPGAFGGGLDDYAAFAARYRPAADAMHRSGVRLGYHNHHFEFQKFEGKTLLERMAEDFPADRFAVILDTYWVQHSGGDPALWLRKLKGLVPCVHFKDMTVAGNQQRMAAVGEGNMNWDAIIGACGEAGTEYALVEQDDCYGEDPFSCLARSYGYLAAMGLE